MKLLSWLFGGRRRERGEELPQDEGTVIGRHRRERQWATRRTRPLWEYVAKVDAMSRPSHAALDGKVWRAEDPIWQTIYPPNGRGCRCRVRALTEEDVAERGLQVNTESKVEQKEVRVASWKEPSEERRSFAPDPGWDRAP